MPLRKRNDVDCQEVDPLIPIMNLVCMLIPLLIFGVVFVRFNVIDVNAPSQTTRDAPPDTEALDLAVMITEQGFHIRVNPAHRLPWMTQAGGIGDGGPDIPKRDDGYDFSTLTDRLREIKGNHRKERRIILGAEEDIAYDVLIKAMDFSRGQKGELFPEVTLTRDIG